MGGWRIWLGAVLVAVGLARAALLVFGGPLAGYGNQYDMHRTGSCLGLFPALPAPADTDPSPNAPIDAYRLDPALQQPACYRSTEVAFVAAVASAARWASVEPGQFRMRWVGGAKFALLAVTALLLAWMLAPFPAAAIVHGLVVLLVMADPAVTLWFNTIYTEFAILWGLYAAIGCLCALALRARWAPLGWLVLVAALAALAFSREQFSLLGPALVVAAAPWLMRGSPSALVLALGVATVTSMISFGLMQRPSAIAHANRADAYLGVVLPAAHDRPAALKVLGLPERCEPMIGATWYLQRGEDVHAVCPEVLRLSSTAFLRFLSHEPRVLARALARALPATQAVAPPGLGTLAGTPRREIGELPWWRGSALHAVATGMSSETFAMLVLAALLATGGATLAAAGYLVMRREPPVVTLLAMLLGGTAVYALLTSIFGDGMSETARHFLPGWLALAAGVISAVVGVAALAARPRAEPRKLALAASGLAVAVALAAWACVAAVGWARTQPMSYGVVDRPVGRALPATELVVQGWALDPWGIERIDVELGSLRRVAEREPHPDMPAHVYPGYADRERARFRAAFTADEFAAATAQGPAILRTTTLGKTGIATEIDRRRIDRVREPQAASAITPTMEAATK